MNVSSEAGDGVNGKSFDDLDAAKFAIERAHPDGFWEEVPGEPADSIANAWEYYEPGDEQAVARIETYAAAGPEVAGESE